MYSTKYIYVDAGFVGYNNNDDSGDNRASVFISVSCVCVCVLVLSAVVLEVMTTATATTATTHNPPHGCHDCESNYKQLPNNNKVAKIRVQLHSHTHTGTMKTASITVKAII